MSRPGTWHRRSTPRRTRRASHLQAFAQLSQLFHQDGSPLHYQVSYLGLADLATASVRADRQVDGHYLVTAGLSPTPPTVTVIALSPMPRSGGGRRDARTLRRPPRALALGRLNPTLNPGG
jgi:hypothetical protein